MKHFICELLVSVATSLLPQATIILPLSLGFAYSGHYMQVGLYYMWLSSSFSPQYNVSKVHHIVTCINISFLLLTENSSHCVEKPHSLYPSISRWTFGFHFEAPINNATVNICVQDLYKCMSSFLLGRYIGVGLLGPMLTLFGLFWETAKLLFKVAALF